MAEEELDLEIDDDIDEEGDLDAVAEEADAEELAEAAAATTGIQGLLASRRNRIIAVVIAVVLVIGLVAGAVVVFSGGSGGKKKKSSSVNSTMQAQQAAEKKEAKKSKRRKKIKYKELFSSLTPPQTMEVLHELGAMEIAFNPIQSGKNYKVMVDQDKIDDARNRLALKGIPSPSATGYELLDGGQTLGVTDFDRRIRFLRALSGELEKAINQFDAVDTCKVQVVLPEQRLFTVVQPPVTASILIRKAPGEDIDDDTVFSIVKLVSNAVENLQVENVTVIDTEGKVLSDGIFERIEDLRQREALGVIEEVPIEEDVVQEPLFKEGRPIIPDFEEMNQWGKIKKQYEEGLNEKAFLQLVGILPLGSFKVTNAADIGPLEDGKIVDIRRLTTSIVVDNNNEDIFLDGALKQQIFSTVSGVVGYVKGRDNIQLTKADFLLFTDAEKKKLENLMSQKSGMGVVGYLGVLGLLIGGAGGFVYYRRRQNKDIFNLFSSKEPSDLDDLGSENDQETLTQLRTLSEENPSIIAKLMDQWLLDEVENEESDVDNEDTLNELSDTAVPEEELVEA